MQAFAPITFNYVQKHEDHLARMYDAQASYEVPELRFDPIKTSVAFFQCEVLIQCLHEGHAEKALFDFIDQEVQYLNEANFQANYLIFWMLELSSLLGFKPYVSGTNPRYFNLVQGEITPEYNLAALADPIVERLAQMLAMDKRSLLVTPCTRAERKLLLNMLLAYFREHVPRFKEIKSLEVYQTLWFE